MGATRQEREREFHNRIFAEHSRQRLDAVYATLHASRLFYEGVLTAHCAGRDVLELGCGSATHSAFLAAHGARLTGIDISDIAVEQARARARAQHFPAVFQRMDAEHLEFPDNRFDLICSVAILHHLDLRSAFSELRRVLRPAGRAVFLEPLGHNPLINLYRRMTPGLRTPDEHPLLMADIAAAREYFETVEAHCFALHSILATPFRYPRWLFRSLLLSLEALDRALFTVAPFARKYAWQVVIVLSDPGPPQTAGEPR